MLMQEIFNTWLLEDCGEGDATNGLGFVGGGVVLQRLT